MAKDKKILDEVASLIGISPAWLNKYTLVTVMFIVWVSFFDKHNIFAYQKLKGTISRMEQEKEKLNEDIAQTLKDKEDLNHNHQKFAREKHLMHLEDEEIILIEQKKSK
ncbi:MAG: septum formation initiator family protein [Saprospiraceae bacterium]|nr:septum formation initiator family protein [Saprospiraceae bacterium]MBK8669430.1 septum formation initiator family protein [Saprospiraceae bacterium]MBL0100770.1 septum formation initiator family protein [Saprospiraceae bacterium]